MVNILNTSNFRLGTRGVNLKRRRGHGEVSSGAITHSSATAKSPNSKLFEALRPNKKIIGKEKKFNY